MLFFPLNPLNHQQDEGKAYIELSITVDDGTALQTIRNHCLDKGHCLSDICSTENDMADSHQTEGSQHLAEVLQEWQVMTIGLQFLVLTEGA